MTCGCIIQTHGHLYLGNNITLVRNDDPANLIPNYAFNTPITSTGAPAIPAGGANIPLLVFDPAGALLPLRFG